MKRIGQQCPCSSLNTFKTILKNSLKRKFVVQAPDKVLQIERYLVIFLRWPLNSSLGWGFMTLFVYDLRVDTKPVNAVDKVCYHSSIAIFGF